MNLSFHEEFVPKILDGTKIHTIRADKSNRWKAGQLIHFCTGLRTKAYRCFKKDTCKSTQDIEIKWSSGIALRYVNPIIKIDGKLFIEHDVLANNDGFATRNHFYAWFKKDFTGKIIHFTDFRYV